MTASSGDTTEHLDSVDLAMHRYAEGEEAAFAEVFAALVPRLRTFLWRLSGSRELAEDLTQETLLRIHHARGSFAAGRRVAPWAYAIARNCYISHARSTQSRLARARADVSKLELMQGAEASGEESSMARQTARVVEKALASMTEARREAFILLRYEGLSVAAAAQIVGTSEGALKIRAFHAYEIIRSALDAMGNSPAGPAEPAAAEHTQETGAARARKASNPRAAPLG